MQSKRKLAVLAVLLLGYFVFAPSVLGYPDHPVRVIVPFPPGGATDVIGRIVAQKLSEKTSQSFYVENMPGASGRTGTNVVAHATPDGATMLVVGSGFVVNPALEANLPYDPVRDFAPVTVVASSPNVLVVTAVIAKRIEMVHELVPKATRIAFLVDPANRALADADTKEARETAGSLGLDLLVLNASSPSEIDAAFSTLVREQAGALLTSPESYFMIQRDQFAALAARNAVPTMYAWRENVLAGGLMSYGTNFLNTTRSLGLYTGRILNGEKPADLPVQQSTNIELTINLKTAKTLGITVPQSLLNRADEVIE